MTLRWLCNPLFKPRFHPVFPFISQNTQHDRIPTATAAKWRTAAKDTFLHTADAFHSGDAPLVQRIGPELHP